MKRRFTWIDPIKLNNDSTSTGQSNNIEYIINEQKNDYYQILPRDSDVLERVQDNLHKIEDEGVRTFLIKIINTVQSTLLNIVNTNNSRSYLSPIILDQDEDNSVFLEWIFQGFRIGFSIHTNIEESSWYLIKEVGKEIHSSSGYLNENNLLLTITNIINYVMENS